MHHVIARNLRHHLQRNSLSPKQCADKAGVLPSFIHDILNGKSTNPSAVKLTQVARCLGIGIAQLTGEHYGHSGGLHIVSAHAFDRPACLPPLQENQAAQEHWHFSERWARRHWGNDADRLSWLQIEGDAMSPSLHHGDVVVVNEAACEADLPGLYVLEEDGRLSVRRLHPARGRIHVSCDNPVWYAYDCLPEHLCLRGRIVWVSRVLH